MGLVLESVLLGDSRWLDALRRILFSSSLTATDLDNQIQYLLTELASPNISTGRGIWIGALIK